MREIDPYVTLEIQDTATQAEIRAAVARLVSQCGLTGPKFGVPEMQARLRDVLAAHEALIANEARGLTAYMREFYRVKRAARHLEEERAASFATPPLPPEPRTWMHVALWLSEGKSEAAKFALGFVAGALDHAAGMECPLCARVPGEPLPQGHRGEQPLLPRQSLSPRELQARHEANVKSTATYPWPRR